MQDPLHCDSELPVIILTAVVLVVVAAAAATVVDGGGAVIKQAWQWQATLSGVACLS